MTRQMKDSGVEWIGEIPLEWNVIPTKRKFTSSKEIIGNKEANFERLALTLNGVVKKSKENSGGLQPEKFETYQILYKDELIFKLIDLENVKTSRVGYSPFTGLVSPVYIRLTNPSESKFGYYYFINMWYQEVFNYLGSGVRSNLTSKDLLNVPYLEISCEQQQRIVKVLDEKIFKINDIISDTQKSIEELKKYKQSLITEVVKKGLDKNVEMKYSGFEIIGSVNSSYKIIPLGYFGTFQNGISKSSEYFGEGYPFVSYGDVYKNRILPIQVGGLVKSTDEDQRNYSVQKGDVFFTRTSETIEEVGMAAVCLETIPQATFAGFVIRFRPHNTQVLLPEYARYYFDALFIRDFFAKEMNLVTRASLSQPLLKKVPVITPSIKNQKVIVKYLDENTTKIDNLVSEKQQVIQELEQYKKSLIYEYVTGKKQV